jgi:hypothetical protein
MFQSSLGWGIRGRFDSSVPLTVKCPKCSTLVTTDFRSSEKKTLKSGLDSKVFRTWISSFRHQEHGESKRRKTFVTSGIRDKTLNPFSVDRKSVVINIKITQTENLHPCSDKFLFCFLPLTWVILQSRQNSNLAVHDSRAKYRLKLRPTRFLRRLVPRV